MLFLGIWGSYLWRWWPLRHWPGKKLSPWREKWDRLWMGPMTLFGQVWLLFFIMLSLFCLGNGWSWQGWILMCAFASPLLSDILILPWMNFRHIELKILHISEIQHGDDGQVLVQIKNNSKHKIFRLQIGLWIHQEGIWPRLLALEELAAKSESTIVVPLSARWPGDYLIRGLRIHHTGFWGIFRRTQWIPQATPLKVKIAPFDHPIPIEFPSQNTERGEDDLEGTRPFQVGDRLRLIDMRTWARRGSPQVRYYQQQQSQQFKLIVALDPLGLSERPLREIQLRWAASLLEQLDGDWIIQFDRHLESQDSDSLHLVQCGFNMNKIKIQRQFTGHGEIWLCAGKKASPPPKATWILWLGFGAAPQGLEHAIHLPLDPEALN